MCKLMNVCNHHMCNPTCTNRMLMLQKSFVSMGFFKPWLTKRIKRTNKWLNNANPWILSSSRCNHDVKFITASGKDNKSLITSQKYQFTQRTCIFFYKL